MCDECYRASLSRYICKEVRRRGFGSACIALIDSQKKLISEMQDEHRRELERMNKAVAELSDLRLGYADLKSKLDDMKLDVMRHMNESRRLKEIAGQANARAAMFRRRVDYLQSLLGREIYSTKEKRYASLGHTNKCTNHYMD